MEEVWRSYFAAIENGINPSDVSAYTVSYTHLVTNMNAAHNMLKATRSVIVFFKFMLFYPFCDIKFLNRFAFQGIFCDVPPEL